MLSPRKGAYDVSGKPICKAACLLLISLTVWNRSLAQDPLRDQEFSVRTSPPAAFQKYDLTVKDGSIMDLGRALMALRSRGEFPLLYDEYDSLVADGVEQEFELHSQHKVNLNFQNAPLWNAVVAICNQMDMGLEHATGGYLELDEFSNTFDYWTPAGPMLMTFRINQSDDNRVTSYINPADAGPVDPLKIWIYRLPGETDLTDIRLRDVSLVSDKGTTHAIPIKESSAAGKWYCEEELPLPLSKISSIQGKAIALIAQQRLTLKLRPGLQTFSRGRDALKISVTDVEESPVLEIEGSRLKPREPDRTMYYFRVELQWGNGLSERERQQVAQYFNGYPPADRELKLATRYQKLLQDKVSYRFISNGNVSPSPEARAEYPSWEPWAIQWATSCKCLVRKTQGRIVLHLYSSDESEIRTCHKLQFVREGLMIDTFQARPSVINDRHLKIGIGE
jgi:hypothetical protein